MRQAPTSGRPGTVGGGDDGEAGGDACNEAGGEAVVATGDLLCEHVLMLSRCLYDRRSWRHRDVFLRGLTKAPAHAGKARWRAAMPSNQWFLWIVQQYTSTCSRLQLALSSLRR
jgi:hypothetical protein